jgi:hypothetical protein
MTKRMGNMSHATKKVHIIVRTVFLQGPLGTVLYDSM